MADSDTLDGWDELVASPVRVSAGALDEWDSLMCGGGDLQVLPADDDLQVANVAPLVAGGEDWDDDLQVLPAAPPPSSLVACGQPTPALPIAPFLHAPIYLDGEPPRTRPGVHDYLRRFLPRLRMALEAAGLPESVLACGWGYTALAGQNRGAHA